MLKIKSNKSVEYTVSFLRLGLGFIFLWAFVDKLWGLGFATCRDAATNTINVMCESAWAAGGSPTAGFLQFATQGPFEEFFQGLAGNVWVDWAFMLGLLLIGLSLMLGVAVYLGVAGGVIMMLLMWLAALPPQNNPLVDDHIIYSLALLLIGATNDKQKLGLGRWWSQRPLVRKYGWLK